jgi:hypothetical protein
MRLLVDREHQRVLGRVDVEPDHVPELLDKTGVGGELEAAHQMRLEPVRGPPAAKLAVVAAAAFGDGRWPSTPREKSREACGGSLQETVSYLTGSVSSDKLLTETDCIALVKIQNRSSTLLQKLVVLLAVDTPLLIRGLTHKFYAVSSRGESTPVVRPHVRYRADRWIDGR